MAEAEKYSWLDEYLESAEKTLGAMDLETLQPTSWNHLDPLIAPEWLEWFNRLVDAAGGARAAGAARTARVAGVNDGTANS